MSSEHEKVEARSAIIDAVVLARLAWCIARIAKEVSATTMEHASAKEPPGVLFWPAIEDVNHVYQKWLELGEHYAPQVLNMLRSGVV